MIFLKKPDAPAAPDNDEKYVFGAQKKLEI
jgi:hypothetical protein